MLSVISALALGVALAAAAPASASLVYLADDAGRAGVYDTVSGIGSPLGALSGNGQIIGAAFDPVANALLLLDRSNNTVYSMDPVTGTSSILFSTAGGFQGGAVSGGLLYGNEEGTMAIAAYNLPGGGLALTGDTPASHTHAFGVDPLTGQVFTMGLDAVIRRVNADGTLGSSVVTGSVGEFVDDLDYFGGDFLATQYSAHTLLLINGTTGASSLFLTAAEVARMNLANVSAVVVGSTSVPAPEPGTLILSALGLAGVVRRFRKH